MESSVAGKYDADARVGMMFSALADPTRRALIADLRDGPKTVGELAARFDVGVPAVSKHLSVLERAGLISRERVAQWRRCRLEAEAFEQLNEWMRHYASLWEGSLDRLDGYLGTLLAGPDAVADDGSAGAVADADADAGATR
ncbi:ArsR/SmtB family transcription factor [Leifsonia poae]|uniref:ArsR/SmtB family transcription factor n=1 Tax=Leifsonia poae TaxID=110933 RepID=UPI0022F255DB|nr:metalloregulator ArsR/SmtB family transcription factor [Leifsonia poae]